MTGAHGPRYAEVLARRYRVPRPRLVRNVTSGEARTGRVVEHGFDPLAVYALGGVPVLGTDLPVIADWLSATGGRQDGGRSRWSSGTG
jgi:hypothetical protein